MEGRGTLARTAVGRALLEFYLDLPFWTITNFIFIVALLPVLALLARGDALWAAVATLPPLFVLAGITSAASRTVDDFKPRWRDLLKGSSHATAPLWLALILSTAALRAAPSPTLFGFLIVLLGTVLVPLVLMLALSSWTPREGQTVWRQATVLSVRFPMPALGLLALAWILGWFTAFLNGVPLLVLPALWANIAAHTVHQLGRGAEELGK